MDDKDLIPQVSKLASELDRRTTAAKRIRPYDEGGSPIPEAVVRGNMTIAYRILMGMSDTPWGSLIVDSVLDRLEVSGVRTKNQALDDATKGRGHAGVWPFRGRVFSMLQLRS